jgi:hypothetical protein
MSLTDPVQPHPEIARFKSHFDTQWVPEGVEFQVEPQRLRGDRRNTDWSRCGLAAGAFVALAILAAGMVYIPVLNVAWAAAMAVLLVAMPYLGARAAIFRYRKGRNKEFTLDFSGPSPRWSSNDDRFWKPVKDFFKV